METNKETYYSKNKDKMLEYQKNRYVKNFEIMQNYNADYYQKNKSKIVQNQKINKLLKIVLRLDEKIDNVTNLVDELKEKKDNEIDNESGYIADSDTVFVPTDDNEDIIINTFNNKLKHKKNISNITKTKTNTIKTKTIETITISFD